MSALVVFIGDLDRVEVTGPGFGRSQGVTVLQGMTMSTKAAPHYESAVRAMSQAAAEAELMHAPVRLAYWRMAALDTLLARLGELRVAGGGGLSQDIWGEGGAGAPRPEAQLSRRVPATTAPDPQPGDDAGVAGPGR